MKEPTSQSADMTDQTVADYLKRHPDFLARHPELLQVLLPPGRETGGGNVVDFQQFQLKNLQASSRSLKTKYEGLVDFCRDNLSVQSQVHDAALRLMRARNLEQLLEVIAIDLANLFDVDVVRLAVESGAADMYETFYSEHNYSGLVFIDPGTCDMALGIGKKALLHGDAQDHPPFGFEQIFADCAGMIESFAFLRLELEQVGRDVLLAFGVRHKDRFHGGQGIELLTFLARIVSMQLDAYLVDLTA